MIYRHPKELYTLTADLTGLPIYKVKHAIEEGQFRYLKEWMKDPDRASLSLKDLGRIELSLSSITKRLKRGIIPKLRNNPTEEAKESFRRNWKLRKKILNFIISKRRTNRNEWREYASKVKESRQGTTKTTRVPNDDVQRQEGDGVN